MGNKDKVQQIEKYAKGIMIDNGAHSYEHASRVRNWALRIAKKEDFKDLEAVEAAALLHDIGMYSVADIKEHGQVGAKIARKYLKANNLFSETQISEIVNAIKYHNTNRGGSGKLLDILRDADMMDGFGAMGIMRCLTSKSPKPGYNTDNIKCNTWKLTAKDFDKRFNSGIGVGEHIVDQLNFQISWYDNLATKTAKQLAKPFVEFVRNYILQLEKEVEQK